ncbi:protein-glutamine gamma-glutamyltransferase K-like isoform X1 [Mytilus edulis]|uniref:protein-glutamine gamma-glutamyltransferase K-like isoform X1 n=1 Tax=Mytilus edulis TaxID=6550 RepID=UPI0039EEBA1F
MSRYHRFPTDSILDRAIDIHTRSVSNGISESGWNNPTRTVTFSDEEKDEERARSNSHGHKRDIEDTPTRPDRRGHYRSDKHVTVDFVDTLSKQNSKEHNTHKFDRVYTGGLVIRRGQHFDVILRFNKKFDPAATTVRFVFTTSENPRPGNGTHVDFILGKELKRNDWSAVIAEKQSKTEYMITISTPANCIVSNWQLVVETISATEGQPVTSVYVHPTLTFILFNPWCKDDDVYFENTSLLKEYVLNDSGAIFHGNYKQIGAKPWFFGQFEDGILEICLWCVQKGFNNNISKSMADPVRVSRAISQIVNSNDDNGILTGKWDSDYVDGIAPLKWNGSVRILKQHVNTKKAVKYGQCFTFSGVVTTICRALGLPCRNVTNFSSAHDSDGTVTIDVYWDLERKENVEGIGKSDSVWNFHCWNDVWMRRNDLPFGNNGWQVIDATPQERSTGMYQCGPMSVAAIKTGNCELLYDGPFVFAEVNADKVNWGRDGGQWFILSLDKSAIGQNISTKVPDGKPVRPHLTDTSVIRQDITDEYKYKDESERERLAVISASRSAVVKRPVYNIGYQDVIFGGFEHRDYILIGKDFKVSLTFRNIGDQMRTLKGKIVCETVSYIGVKQDVVKEYSFSTQLAPRTEGESSLEVKCLDYLPKISEQMAMKVSAVVQVEETGHIQAFQDDFRLRKPDIQVEVLDNNMRVGHPFKCRLSFVNPLPARLANCVLTVEGPGLDAEEQFNLSNIGSHQEWAAILELTPKKPGRRQISVSLDTHQIHDISGVEEIKVYP